MTKTKPKTKSEIGEKLAQEMFEKLGLNSKGKPLRSRLPRGRKATLRGKSPSPSRNLPFRIPAIEKTTRQAQSSQGYKASAAWQTASLLRDLILLWTPSLSRRFPYTSRLNPGTISRLRTQLEDATRSTVSTLEKGWSRPTSKEYLNFIGFSQGSLTEIRGDIERRLADGILKTRNYGKQRESRGSAMSALGIPTPSRKNPYPPVASRKYPERYGSIRERLREYTGKDIKAEDLSYEVFIELINKVDYLLKRTVEGLQERIISHEKKKLKDEITSHWRKNW